jgi:hypothetical protein
LRARTTLQNPFGLLVYVAGRNVGVSREHTKPHVRPDVKRDADRVYDRGTGKEKQSL